MLRWYRWAAVGAFLTTVPSGIWRMLMIVGLMPGTTELREVYLTDNPASAYAYAYVVGISIAQMGAGFLSVGLIQPWGERFFGRNVPLTPAVIVATLGGLAATYLFNIFTLPQDLLSNQGSPIPEVSGLPLGVSMACYFPIFMWGPLELFATFGYWQRRRHASFSMSSSPG